MTAGWRPTEGRPVRVGLVGYGLAGAAFHAPLIQATDGLEFVAIVTSREVPSGVRRLARVEDLWALDVDLIVVATPNSTHVAIARDALQAGAHVVVDKPLAVTAREAEDLVRQADESNLLLSVFQNRRWDGDFLTLRDLVASHRLGKAHRLESRFERWRPQVAEAWRESEDPALGGGQLLDLGTHLIDQALQLFGSVTSVYAEIATVRPGAVVDDDVFLALRHVGGEISHLWMSAVAADAGPRLRLLAEGGAWSSFELDSQEAQLRQGRGPTMRASERTRKGSSTGLRTRPVPASTSRITAESMRRFVEEVRIRWIRGMRWRPSGSSKPPGGLRRRVGPARPRGDDDRDWRIAFRGTQGAGSGRAR